MYILGSVYIIVAYLGLKYRFLKLEAYQLGGKLETPAVSSYNEEIVESLHNEPYVETVFRIKGGKNASVLVFYWKFPPSGLWDSFRFGVCSGIRGNALFCKSRRPTGLYGDHNGSGANLASFRDIGSSHLAGVFFRLGLL